MPAKIAEAQCAKYNVINVRMWSPTRENMPADLWNKFPHFVWLRKPVFFHYSVPCHCRVDYKWLTC